MGCQPAPAGGSLSGRRLERTHAHPTAIDALQLERADERRRGAITNPGGMVDAAEARQQNRPPALTGWRTQEQSRPEFIRGTPAALTNNPRPTARASRRPERQGQRATRVRYGTIGERPGTMRNVGCGSEAQLALCSPSFGRVAH